MKIPVSLICALASLSNVYATSYDCDVYENIAMVGGFRDTLTLLTDKPVIDAKSAQLEWREGGSPIRARVVSRPNPTMVLSEKRRDLDGDEYRFFQFRNPAKVDWKEISEGICYIEDFITTISLYVEPNNPRAYWGKRLVRSDIKLRPGTEGSCKLPEELSFPEANIDCEESESVKVK